MATDHNLKSLLEECFQLPPKSLPPIHKETDYYTLDIQYKGSELRIKGKDMLGILGAYISFIRGAETRIALAKKLSFSLSEELKDKHQPKNNTP